MDYQGEPSSRAGYDHRYGPPGLYQQSQGPQQTYIHDGLPSGKWDGQTQEMGMQQTQQIQQMHQTQQMQKLQMQNQYVYQQHQQYMPAPSTTAPHTYYQTPSQPQYHFSQYAEHQQQQVPEFIHPIQPYPLNSNQLQQQVSQPLQQQTSRQLLQSPLQQQPSASASKSSMKVPGTPNQPSSQPVEPQTLMVSLAEEYFEAAHSMTSDVARNMTTASLDEYQKLVATGLGCLEVVLRKMRLAPKLEARIRLRYAGVLFDETENYMEAETALSHGILLCEQVLYGKSI
jgi:Cohesin loading factor